MTPDEETLRLFYQAAYGNGRYDVEYGEPDEDIPTVDVLALWDDLAWEARLEVLERRLRRPERAGPLRRLWRCLVRARRAER